jgi:hypothetical protein
MSEQEKMDRSLHQLMKATPPPALSSAFDAQLAARLRPRRLDWVGRLIMVLYALGGLILSVWVMRGESIGWVLIVTAILGSLLVGAIAKRSFGS